MGSKIKTLVVRRPAGMLVKVALRKYNILQTELKFLLNIAGPVSLCSAAVVSAKKGVKLAQVRSPLILSTGFPTDTFHLDCAECAEGCC